MTLSQSAALHDVASRHAASRALTATHPSGPNAEAADDLPVHAPWNRHSYQLPCRHVPRTHGLQCRRTRVAPPNQPCAGVHAARRRRPLRVVLRPCHDPYPDLVPLVRKKTFPNRLAHGYKAGRSFLARAPSRRCSPWMPYGQLHPACFSSQARAAPHSSRTPSRSCARLLACPSHRLTRASAPAAATGQPSTGSAPRSSPEPTNHLNTSPRPP
jgi:hypothetical protein